VNLEGKRIIVTGAATGIGRATALLVASLGASVAAFDVNDEEGRGAVDAITSTGGTARYWHVDVAVESEVEPAVQDATTWLGGGPDVLLHLAGILKGANAPIAEFTEATWDAVIDVNLKGSFLVAQAVARAMVSAGGGAIVNMSSVNGTMAIPSIASYNASKGGIDQLTRVMALALADRGVRVNAVGPGTIATELARAAVLGSDDARERILSRTPLRRLGEPGEIADAVAFLLSDAASYITGEIVYVDGGRRALNYTMPPRV